MKEDLANTDGGEQPVSTQNLGFAEGWGRLYDLGNECHAGSFI